MARRVLGVSKMTTREAVLGELGWGRLEARRKLARMRFWGKLVRMEEDRLVKRVYLVRRLRFRRGGSTDSKNWCYQTMEILESLGLGHMWESEEIGSEEAWNSLITSAIRGEEQRVWRERVGLKPKLRTYEKLKYVLEQEDYLEEADPERRRLYTMLRTGTNRLRVETGRWKGEQREERVCQVCLCGEVEDERHFLLKCAAYNEARSSMFRKIRLGTGYDMECMDDVWKMAAMLGEGVGSEEEIKRARKYVMQYVQIADKIRRQWIDC
jgi:hypothetical protein